MRYVVNEDSFQPAQVDADESLIVHTRTRPTQNSCLVVLVHGWGGHHYTTWNNLPAFLYEDFPGVDIALYGYRSSYKRLLSLRSIAPEKECVALRDLLVLLPRYLDVVLIGHSMGGLMAKGAVARTFQALGRWEYKRLAKHLAGVVLAASPQVGTRWIPRALAWLADFRVLRLHSPFSREIERVITENVTINGPVRRRHSRRVKDVPFRVLVAAGDRWVSSFSAQVGVANTYVSRDTHGSIVKPTSREADSYQFLRKCLTEIFGPSVLEGPGSGWHILRTRVLHIDQLELARTFLKEYFSVDVITSDNMRSVLLRDPEAIQVVWREDIKERTRQSIVGYLSVFGLNDEGVQRLKENGLPVTGMPAEWIATAGESPAALWVGALAGRPEVRDRVVREAQHALLQRAGKQASLEILTWPATAEGKRLCEDFDLAEKSGGEREIRWGNARDAVKRIAD